MSFIRRAPILFLAALALIAAACSDSTEPAKRSVATVAVVPGTRTLTVGDSYAYAGRALDLDGELIGGVDVRWASSNPHIATISTNGTVNAIAAGTTTISASAEGKTGTAQLVVNEAPVAPVATIAASPTALVLELGQTRQLTAVTRDAAGNVLTGRIVNWTSDSPNVATVSNAGLVTAVGEGYVTILVASEGVTFGVAATIVREEGFPGNLLYHNISPAGAIEIFTLDPTTGAAPTRINAGTVSRQPTASPNGQRIAFAVSQIELGTTRQIDDIFAVDRNGMNVKQLTTVDGVEDSPAWSPMANRIVYRHFDGPRTEIWVMNADGTGQTNLTADISATMILSAPSWSPDGQRITFAALQPGAAGTTGSIWTMKADGGDKKMLTSTLTGFDGAPSWSPDGQRIALIRFYAGDADIAIVSSAGGDVTRVPLAGDQAAPAWSPDGALIAFAQQNAGRSFIYTVKPNGTDARLRTPAGGLEPAWISKQ